MEKDTNKEPLRLDKPHKTYKQQLNHLKNEYGLQIDYQQDISLIKSISYYDLINGTKDFFLVNNRYAPETRLTHLAILHFFDKSFQGILFKYSLYAETKFKNILSNLIAEEFGCTCDEYLDHNKYMQHKSKSVIKPISAIKEVLSDSNPYYPTKHYLDNKNHVPPWILFKNISFSTSIDLSFFLPDKLKIKFSKQFLSEIELDELRFKTVYNCITIIRQFRNEIAHNYRFSSFKSKGYNIPILSISILFRGNMVTNNEANNCTSWNNVYSMILSLMALNDHVVNKLMIEDIAMLYNQNQRDPLDSYISNLYFEKIGLPKNFIERLENYY